SCTSGSYSTYATKLLIVAMLPIVAYPAGPRQAGVALTPHPWPLSHAVGEGNERAPAATSPLAHAVGEGNERAPAATSPLSHAVGEGNAGAPSPPRRQPRAPSPTAWERGVGVREHHPRPTWSTLRICRLSRLKL